MMPPGNKVMLKMLVFLPFSKLFFFFVGCQPQILESEAPFFAITTYETEFYEKGNVFELDGNSEKPTVINFWFPSCPPCVKEMPDIDSVYRLYKDQVDVVGVQMIGLDSVSDGSDFVREGFFYKIPHFSFFYW